MPLEGETGGTRSAIRTDVSTTIKADVSIAINTELKAGVSTLEKNAAQGAGVLLGAKLGGTAGQTSSAARIVASEETMTLHRGVNESSPAFANATNGVVVPRGGTATAAEHNAGNTQSLFTSWTPNVEVAQNYALRPSGNGVVLSTTVPKTSIVPSPSLKNVVLKPSGKYVNEQEVLLKGTIKGCKVQAINLD
jgi:hypothetical protein